MKYIIIFILIYVLVNFCDIILDLKNDRLIIDGHAGYYLPLGEECQWIISAVDDKHYVNLEIQSLDVRIVLKIDIITIPSHKLNHLFVST